MRVRLLQAATVQAHDHWPEGHWHPAGAEVDIPDEHFDPALHEALSAELPPEVPSDDEFAALKSEFPEEEDDT